MRNLIDIFLGLFYFKVKARKFVLAHVQMFLLSKMFLIKKIQFSCGLKKLMLNASHHHQQVVTGSKQFNIRM